MTARGTTGPPQRSFSLGVKDPPTQQYLSVRTATSRAHRQAQAQAQAQAAIPCHRRLLTAWRHKETQNKSMGTNAISDHCPAN